MKRNVFALILVLLLGLTTILAGCSSDETTSDTDSTNKEVKTIDSKEALKNVNVRKALAMSVEKSFIADEILANGSTPIDYIVPGTITAGEDFRSAKPEGYNNYNIDEAVNYWNTAKEELGFDTLEIEVLTFDSEGGKKIAEYIKAQWETNLEGLTVTINQQPFENKLALADKGEYDVNFSGWGPDYPDPMTYLDLFVTGSGHNNIGMSNEEYDSIIEAAKLGDLLNDPEARWAALQDAERILLEEEVALIPLYQKGGAYLQQDFLTGIVEPTYGPDLLFEYADTTKTNDAGQKVANLVDSSDIPTMDLSLATNSVSFQAIGNTIEGLFKFGENGDIVPALAKDYTVEEKTDENGKTVYVYTFNLRQDSVWSNGTPVTAHDFVYSLQRLGNPQTGAQYAFLLESAAIKNASAVVSGELAPEELGVYAIDDYTLVMELDLNVPFFTDLLAFPSLYPLNQAFVEEMGDTFGTSPETTLYNGPFTLTKWKLGFEYELEKNPTYYNASNVNLDIINFRIVKETSASVNMYEAGDIDRTGLSSEFVSQYVDNANFHKKENLSVFYIEINNGFQGR